MFKRIANMEAKHQILFSVIIGFAVIAFWRGLWGLFDVYLFPGSEIFRFWTLVAIGIIILLSTDYATKELM